MARIPIYEQRTAPSGMGPSVRATPAQVDQSMGRAIQNVGQMMGGVAQDMYRRQEIEREKISREQEKISREQEQLAEDRAALEAANALSKGEAYWHERVTTQIQNWKPGDPDMRESLGKEYETWLSETATGLPTDRARRYFQSQAFSMRSRIDRNLFDSQERITVDALAQSTIDGMDADYETIYRDPSLRAEVVRRRVEVIQAQSRIPIARRMELARKFIDGANMAAESSELERDPVGYFQRRFGEMPSSPVPGEGSAGFDSAVSAVLKHEGGHTPSDGNTGQPAIYGLNRKWNEKEYEEAVRITREQGEAAGRAYATEVYRTKYWNAINGDTLPPELQGTAMDAAVNQGQNNARKWLRESGGDVAKFNELRRAHYERLLEKPENARFRNAWMNRLEFYEKLAANTLPASEDVIVPEAPESFRNLPYQEREKLRREADRVIRQNTAAAAQSLRGRLQDSIAMARNGIADPQPLTPDAFAVLGADAPVAYDEYQRNQVLARDVASMQNATNMDLQAVASGALRRAVPGEGYADEDARDQIRAKAAAQVLKQRTEDPAGFVARTMPEVTKAAQAVFAPNLSREDRAAAMKNLVTQTIAAQQQLGIQQPRILSAAAVEDLTRRINTARRPEDVVLLVEALEMDYGKGKSGHFGQVLTELEREGKLTPALRIIPNLNSASARETVAALSFMKMDDLKAGVDGATQSDIRKAAVSYASELARTMPPVSGSGAGLLSSYQDMIERIAYDRMQSGRERSGADAAESAYRMLLGHYQFSDQLRIPAALDSRQVRGALDVNLRKNVVPRLSLADVPLDLTGARTPDEALAEWRDLVATNAVWYTSPDDDAVELWVSGQNGVLYRVNSGGKQVAATFDELMAVTPQQMREPHNRGQAAQRRFREQLARETEAIRRQVEAEDAAATAGQQGAR